MVVFTKTSSPQLYAVAGGGDVWLAYYLPQPPASPPDSITLTEALAGSTATQTLAGSFVFSAAPGLSLSTCASGIVTWMAAALAQPAFPASRCMAWFRMPQRVMTPPVTADLASVLLLGLADNGSAVNVGLNIPFVEDKLYFTLNNGLAIGMATEDRIGFTAKDQNGLMFSGASAPTQSAIPQATIPFEGECAGTIDFAVALQRQDLASKLSWGMQILYTDNSGTLRSQLYPLASGNNPGATDMLGFAAFIDPSDVANLRITDRTILLFGGTTNGNTGVTLCSGYQLAWADAIELTPVIEETQGQIPAGLVLTPGNYATATGTQFAFAPRGDFIMTVAAPKNETAGPLLCGLTPTETITFIPGKDRIRFISGQSAYASSYPPQAVSTLGPPVDTNAPLLTDIFRTAWATVVNAPADNTGIHYAAQPKGQPLFGRDDVVTPTEDKALGPVNPGYLLPERADFSAPLMPYALAAAAGAPTGFTAETIADIEARVIAPARRSAIGGPASARTSVAAPHRRAALLKNAGNAIQVTTPMGLVATVNADGRWTAVDLAYNAEAGIRMGFDNPSPDLQQALQSAELFLVAANNRELGTLTTTPLQTSEAAFINGMSVADWEIEANVGNNKAYGDYNDILIIKGCRGRLVDLVNRPDVWTQAEKFSVPDYTAGGGVSDPNDIVVLSTWLAEYIAAAEAQAQNPYFANFVDIVHSESWTGILVLKATLKKLPSDLDGLLATISKADTYAHHFGVTVSPVDAASVTVTNTSSMFQLVNYVAPGFIEVADTLQPLPPSGSSPYDFKLLTLKALFENSAVARFESSAQLTLGEWFGDLVNHMDPGGNSYNTIFLSGHYQKQEGVSRYVLDCDNSSQFYLNSNVITKIEAVKAQYTTIDSATSRFDLWGFIDFACVRDSDENPFDIFSFGNEPGSDNERTGLSFSGLGLTMVTDSNQNAVFSFDASHMSFDLAQSTVRPDSLYSCFALRTPSVMVGTKEADPMARGYLTLATDVAFSGVGKENWYGLVFGLDMGTVGALAGDVGLSSTLLTAWGPNPDSASVGAYYPVRLGLALPWVNPTAKLMSLEGVLKLAIGDLKLSYSAPDETSAKAWVLSLSDIALKFLSFVKIPPNGAISFACFGNPDAKGKPTSLGWYAVYNQDPPKNDKTGAALPPVGKRSTAL